VTLESSAKAEIIELADKDRRSASNFVGLLLEKALARGETRPPDDPR
jgi:hypothetical protein